MCRYTRKRTSCGKAALLQSLSLERRPGGGREGQRSGEAFLPTTYSFVFRGGKMLTKNSSTLQSNFSFKNEVKSQRTVK